MGAAEALTPRLKRVAGRLLRTESRKDKRITNERLDLPRNLFLASENEKREEEAQDLGSNTAVSSELGNNEKNSCGYATAVSGRRGWCSAAGEGRAREVASRAA
jgi:hypothetical protein